MKKNGEDRICTICGTKERPIRAVKYCSNRLRLWACKSCWEKYYKSEVESEKIKISRRIGIFLDLQKDMAVSGRKLRNLVYVLMTLVIVEVIGQLVIKGIFGTAVLYDASFCLSEELVGNVSGILALLGGILIVACLLLLLFRVFSNIVHRLNE